VTLVDVADAAGVSKTTASRALSKVEHPDVSAGTRETVRRVAEELGYRANATARALRSGRVDVLSVVMPVLGLGYVGWWAPALSAARAEAARHGYRLVVHLLDSRSQELGEVLDGLVDFPTDALILITPLLTAAQESQVQRLKVPVVFLDDTAHHPWAPTVCGDNYGGGYLAGRHLVECGCRRIAAIVRLPEPTYGRERLELTYARERLDGFRAALREAGVVVRDDLIVGSEETFMPPPPRSLAIEALLARGETFDGVFAVTDHLAATALRSLRNAGLRVPGDVAVVGYDDERAAYLVEPPLTTIRQPVAEFGRMAVRVALAALNGGTDPERITLPVELVVRRSSAAR